MFSPWVKGHNATFGHSFISELCQRQPPVATQLNKKLKYASAWENFVGILDYLLLFFFHTICLFSLLELPAFQDRLHKMQRVSWRCCFTSRATGLPLEKCVKPSASDMPHTNSSWERSRDAQEDNHSKSVFSRLSRRWSVSNNLRLY